MFDWLEFDKNRKREMEEQINKLQGFLSDYVSIDDNLRERPIYPENREELLERIRNLDIPAEGRDSVEAARDLVENVLKSSIPIHHPRFFSFVASAVSPYSVAGAMLTDLYNPYGGCYDVAPGAALCEQKVISWMGELAGYPEETRGGEFMSGGSMATLTGMAAARDNRLEPAEFGIGTAYLSDQTHSSVEKGLRILGFRRDQIQKIPTDEEFMMNTQLLKEKIEKDIKEGRKPFLVVGTIGTTNTGSIDPLEKIADIAKEYGLWFHVDGAFGGSTLISPIYRKLTKGVERSDSMTWDTHKWLMQPYSCSTLLVRDIRTLVDSMIEHPEYLTDVINADYTDGWDMSIEMSKPRRGIKLWYTLQATGTRLFEELIEYTWNNARVVQQELLKRENWEVLSSPSCGTINFRYHPEGYDAQSLDKLTADISREITGSGFAYLVTTTIAGVKSLRMCMINANSTEADIIATIDRLDQIAKELTK